jgi:hypothetical protein
MEVSVKRTLWSAGVMALFTIVGCGDGMNPLEVGESGPLEAASAPVLVPFHIVFEDLNPCSGEIHTVTISGTERVLQRDGRVVVHGQRTVTTSSGFTGRGTHSFVANGNIEKFTLTDILRHPSGAQIRAHLAFVFDLRTLTVRVQQGAVTCVRP